MTPPTLQAIADAVIWADGPSTEAVATMWVDAGCPRLTEAETAVLAHVAATDLDSPEFWQAVRALRQERDRDTSPTPTEDPG